MAYLIKLYIIFIFFFPLIIPYWILSQFSQHSHMICGLKMQLLFSVDFTTGYVEMSIKMQF